ncbi:zinc-binding dehydrogenase [Paraburkholderia fungorum]|uniref:zinc-binding dehydrogenase n=1 Tax=Paraburkholderia fungorum TaxID=134537 RepID=UPI0038B869D5
MKADQEDVLECVASLTGGAMADLVIDCESGGPGAVVSAVQLARKRGTAVLGGQKRVPIPEFDSNMIIARFLTVKGMRGHSYQSVELALQLITANRHDVTQISPHTFSLDETDLALRTLQNEGVSGAIHMTIDPWK